MKKSVLKYMTILPVLVWYGVIWRLSAQSVSQSRGLSSRALAALLSRVSPIYYHATAEIQGAAIKTFTFYIRKGAHMTCYFFLAVLLFCLLSLWIKSLPRRCGIVASLCLIAATVDEFHQKFVPGRSGELRDICIDLTGCALALVLCLLFVWLWRARRGVLAPALLMLGAACGCAVLSLLLPQYLARSVLGLSVHLAPIAAQVLRAGLLGLAAGFVLLAVVPLIGRKCRRMQPAD